MVDEKTAPVTVLVADDDDDTRHIVCKILERNDVITVGARNGREAVDAAQRSAPALIFMDLSMPELDGIAAARLIRLDERLRDIPIVFLTAHGHYGIKLFEDLTGIDTGGPLEYLAKPVGRAELDDMLRKYVGF
jgi:CheY-like chemotaxis protein